MVGVRKEATNPDTFASLQNGMAGVQQTSQLKESQLVFFGLRDHLWLKGPVLGARAKTPSGVQGVKK